MTLERIAQFKVFKNIDRMKRRADSAQGGHGLGRKPALRKVGRALHEQHDGLGGELALDAIDNFHGVPLKLCPARVPPGNTLNYGGWATILQTAFVS